MDLRRHLFLTFGLQRGYPNERRPSPGRLRDKLEEPREARACRRNTIILAGGIILAWASGAEVQDLDLFGIKPAGGRGVIVLCMAAMLIQSYWHLARYWHLRENSTRVLPASFTELEGKTAEINWEGEWDEAVHLSLRVADFLANWAATLLTLSSWCILVSWMLATQTKGT